MPPTRSSRSSTRARPPASRRSSARPTSRCWRRSRPRSRRRACWSSARPGWAATAVPMTGGQGSMSKLKAGQVAVWTTRDADGPRRPLRADTECPLEKWFRDAKIYELFEGTAEIQRLVISRMQVGRLRRAPAGRRRDRRAAAESANGDAAKAAAAAARLRLAAGDSPSLSGRGLTSRRMAHAHPHAHGMEAAVALRRAGNRRRMRTALAINAGMLAVGGRRRPRSSTRWRCSPTPGTCSPTSGPSSLGLVAAASPPAAAGRGGPSAFTAARCSPRWSTASPWWSLAVLIVVAAIGRLSRPAGGRGRRACSSSGCLGLAGNAWATVVLARGERSDINLEAVLRHSAADALGSIAVVVVGARAPRLRLARGGPDREPRDRRPDPRLVGAPHPRAVRRADGERPAGRGRRRAGRRDLRGRGRSQRPRAARLDRHLGVRGPRRPRRHRPRTPTATASGASSSSCSASASGSSTPPSRWRRRATEDALLQVELQQPITTVKKRLQ